MAGGMLPQQIALIASATEEATRFPEKREGHNQLLSGWRGGAKSHSAPASGYVVGPSFLVASGWTGEVPFTWPLNLAKGPPHPDNRVHPLQNPSCGCEGRLRTLRAVIVVTHCSKRIPW